MGAGAGWTASSSSDGDSSVKYEEVYLKAYTNRRDARSGPTDYFGFYNILRHHQSLDRGDTRSGLLPRQVVTAGGLTWQIISWKLAV